MIYLDRHVIISFLYTLWTVDQPWPTVNHDLPFIHFLVKMLFFFPSDMVYERSLVIDLAHEVDFFHQKAETYSRCCSRICAISLPEFHIFADMFSLTRFFHKKGVNLNFLRQNKYDKIRPIISYKRQNLVNTNTKRAQIVSQNPQKSTTRLLPTSFRTIVRRYWFRLIPPLFLVQVSLKSPTTKMGGVPIKLLLISYNFCSG